MAKSISKKARLEVIEALRRRYPLLRKKEKTKVLSEFVGLADCHRKHAIRLLSGKNMPVNKDKVISGRRIYDEAVRTALIVLWEASDRICGKRLKALLPSLMESMERHGHLALDPLVRKLITSASASTIDRLLAPIRGEAGQRRRRKKRKKVGGQIPTRTFSDWKTPLPGYLEVDFVVHCGGTMTGSCIHSFVATDVCSGWTETIPLLAREQSLVVEGVKAIRKQFPIPILGINSDNDSAFINETLLQYCKEEKIEFTRSRAYRKNDQAWIEQKNGAVIRRFVGHDRYSGPVIGQTMAHLYAAVRLFVNYFQPSFKLIEKSRDGGKVKRRYDQPATPCDRLIAHPSVSPQIRERLRKQRMGLDPIALLKRVREAQGALASLNAPALSEGPPRESLDHFLSRLPSLWRQGEVRPTHLKRPQGPRSWRTRKDPFEDVWSEVLPWLQRDPDATAKSLFERLQNNYPDRFPHGQLRSLQRRIKAWRGIMAKELVYSILENDDSTELKAITVDSYG